MAAIPSGWIDRSSPLHRCWCEPCVDARVESAEKRNSSKSNDSNSSSTTTTPATTTTSESPHGGSGTSNVNPDVGKRDVHTKLPKVSAKEPMLLRCEAAAPKNPHALMLGVAIVVGDAANKRATVVTPYSCTTPRSTLRIATDDPPTIYLELASDMTNPLGPMISNGFAWYAATHNIPRKDLTSTEVERWREQQAQSSEVLEEVLKVMWADALRERHGKSHRKPTPIAMALLPASGGLFGEVSWQLLNVDTTRYALLHAIGQH